MRHVITGGAGFLGSHLIDRLIERGDQVVCVDNFSTGRWENLAHLVGRPGFSVLEADVCTDWKVRGPVDTVAHLASPASPPDYHRLPLETLSVGSRGTEQALRLAEHSSARFIVASTSEVYGDPTVHPQHEGYFGNVNPIGPRSVYDEAKRFAEAISMAYARTRGVDVGVLRIFNTYGPRMRARDGRVVTSFITQALNDAPITIYGDGSQTRSFCYVDDLVQGIVAMLDSHERGPVNLGNPQEYTVLELAQLIIELTGSRSTVEYFPLPTDDPTRRQPDITRAISNLNWEPGISAREGLLRTIRWFRDHEREMRDALGELAGPQFEGSSLQQA